MKTQKEINADNLISAQLHDIELMRANTALNSWLLLKKEQDKKNIYLAEKARLKSFREEKIIDFIFFAILIMLASFSVLLCGSSVWMGDYASAVFFSPFATVAVVLTLLFYKKVVSIPFEPMNILPYFS